ncbi:hypothetical protein Q4555_13755 [Octadecabacter sp. 1_MG-2023]|uniref:hypothetical protein n=1 Tax=unclassified Octadecabacter TaxID=196158 RepID=UPI001C0904E4|nr:MULTISPECIES: hypothetical protein [unclassified Octadecabacter]MBU2991764.1 hypothetical protein [Octadecabacter sp. B2R22]MDO6735737.1 hypothetical protein [Octadecabacter sp. 1_MG-2023]
MTRTRASTLIYWVLAVVFAWGLVITTLNVFGDSHPPHWRYIPWWASLLGAHIARTALVVLIWFAFLFDAIAPLMRALYGAQGGAFIFLGMPIVILGLLIYLWRRGQYTRFSKVPQS